MSAIAIVTAVGGTALFLFLGGPMVKQIEVSEERPRGDIGSLQEGFVQVDADDRLVVMSEVYRQLTPSSQEVLEKRGTFAGRPGDDKMQIIRENIANHYGSGCCVVFTLEEFD